MDQALWRARALGSADWGVAALLALLLGSGFGAGLAEPVAVFFFLIGSFAMRGAGCTINDMTDRDLDAKVDRTRNRPLASGRLAMGQAMIFLGAQLLVGLVVLLQLNLNAVYVGLAALPLIVAYPWMKRITWWPQLFLGITFKWGALVGWTAATGQLGWPAILLYVGGIFWTLAMTLSMPIWTRRMMR